LLHAGVFANDREVWSLAKNRRTQLSIAPRVSEHSCAVLGSSLEPSLKVIYLSGATNTVIVRRGVVDVVPCMQKPFSISVLATKRARRSMQPDRPDPDPGHEGSRGAIAERG
jgi:hypothetical protein